MNVGMPQFNVPPIDPKTGQWNRTWFLFLQDLWNRTGGSQGQTIYELVTDLPEDAGIEEIKAGVNAMNDALNQSPPVAINNATDDQTPPFSVATQTEDPHARLEALEASVALALSEIQAIKQGMQT